VDRRTADERSKSPTNGDVDHAEAGDRCRLGGILLARPHRIAPNIVAEPCDPADLRALLRPARSSDP